MESEIKRLVQQLGFEKTKKITNKTVELLRLLQVKCPYGIPGQGEVSKNMICIEIATILLRIPDFQKELAIRLAGVTPKEYQQNFTWIQNKLDLKFTVSPSDFCVKMGCTGIISFVTEVFEFFKKSYLEDFPEQRRKYVDFSNMMYIGAVLYLCAKSAKLSLDKKTILKEIGGGESDFTSTCEIVSKKCESLLNETKTTIEIKKTKKKLPTKNVKKKPEKEEAPTIEEVSKDEKNQQDGKENESKEKINGNETENVKKRKIEKLDEDKEQKFQPRKRKQVTLHYFQADK